MAKWLEGLFAIIGGESGKIADVTSDNKLKTNATIDGLVIDQYKGAATVIDVAHEQIHLGKHYTYSVYYSSVSIGTNKDFLISVPAGKYPHLVFNISTSGAITVQLDESPTVSAYGTAKTPLNNNRASTNTSSISLYEAPTVTSTGTQLETYYIGSGNEKRGGQQRSDTEWILNQSTLYLLRVKMLDNNINISIELEWYE